MHINWRDNSPVAVNVLSHTNSVAVCHSEQITCFCNSPFDCLSWQISAFLRSTTTLRLSISWDRASTAFSFTSMISFLPPTTDVWEADAVRCWAFSKLAFDSSCFACYTVIINSRLLTATIFCMPMCHLFQFLIRYCFSPCTGSPLDLTGGHLCSGRLGPRPLTSWGPRE